MRPLRDRNPGGGVTERAQIKHGLAWFGSATLLSKLFDVAGIVVLLRFLGSEELGLASLALGVSIVFESFGGLGVEAAIVQSRQVTDEALSSLFWFCMLVAVLICGAVFVAAPLIAAFYEEPRLEPLLWASTVKFVTLGATIVPFQLLIRDLRFREVSMIQAVTSLFVNVAKIALAIAGTGAWALVAPNALYGVLFLVIVARVTPFRPAFRFVWREIREFVSFGVRTAASTIMMESSRNLDYFLVGKFLGLPALGVYRVAFEVAMMPMETLSQTTYRVAYPVFSRVSAEWGRLEAAFFDTARMLLTMTGPIAVVVFFGAGDLLRLIAGDKWLDAVPAIQVLCLAGVLRTSERLFTRLFNAVGKPNLTVVETLATLVVLGAAMSALLMSIGDRVGVLAVCYAWVASYPLLFAVAYGLARSVMPFRFTTYARHLAPTAACVAIMALMTAAAAALRPATGPAASPLAGLFIVAGVGLGSYMFALRAITGLRLRDVFK